MCMVDDGDYAEVYVRRDRRARKPHRCYECARVIAPGEGYEEARSLYPDGWSTFRTCAHCQVVQAWLRRECDGFLHGGTLEDLRSHWWEDDLLRGMELGRLVVGSRRGWKRRDGAGLMPVPALKAS